MVGPTGSTGLLFCLRMHMPEDAFADLPSDTWGRDQILPQVGSFTAAAASAFVQEEDTAMFFSVFDQKLHVMCNKFSQ